MEIREHRLEGDKVTWKESPNHGGQLEGGVPDSIIIHYTAGSSAESSVATLCNPAYKVSAHLVVGRKSELYQLVPFDTIAWHAGPSSWGGRTGYNRYSLGIEIDNAGLLTPNGSGGYVSWFNHLYGADDVLEAVHRNESRKRFWHRYDEKQIETVFDICGLLCSTYPIREILGHEEIAPKRKTDPGPAFPLDRLRDYLLGPGRAENSAAETLPLSPNAGVITAGRLNIRSGPGIDHPAVTEPLKGGTVVEILEEKAGWLKVRHVVEGWVSAKYLQGHL